MHTEDDQSAHLAETDVNNSGAAHDEISHTDTLPELTQALRTAELSAQEHYDAWLRAKADADNMRKRAQIDIANAHKYAIENFATELLAVRDSLEAALNDTSLNNDTLRNGVTLTLRQLTTAFEKSNLQAMNPLGEKFDPHRHQAISMIDSEAEPNTVVNVLQKGYQLHERVIRPALVSVAKAKN